MNDEGYKQLARFLADELFPKRDKRASRNEKLVREAVLEKNWMWHNDFKIPNGVHVFGRRYEPYGPENYPYELTKIREMTDIRDKAIWSEIRGKKTDLVKKDRITKPLPTVETNYKRGDLWSNDKSGSMVKGDAEKETQLVNGNSIYLSQKDGIKNWVS